MPQLFGRGANSLARGTIIGTVLGVALLAIAGFAWVRSPYVTGVGQPVEQPIPFSHKHHVTDDGLDCRYCHTSVEHAAFAGMPPTATCMNCHSQIYSQSPVLAPIRESAQMDQPLTWNRVNQLPDFVYFDHSIHIAKGVGCSSCHGAVDQMPLTTKAESFQMSFCVECHQNPQNHLRPRSEIFNMNWTPPANQAVVGRQLMEEYHVEVKDSCSTCHH
jgi:hypothetical protein